MRKRRLQEEPEVVARAVNCTDAAVLIGVISVKFSQKDADKFMTRLRDLKSLLERSRQSQNPDRIDASQLRLDMFTHHTLAGYIRQRCAPGITFEQSDDGRWAFVRSTAE